MNKLRWTQEEVISYLEYLIQQNAATEKEMELYLDYTWTGDFDKSNHLHTYKKVVRKMKREFEGE